MFDFDVSRIQTQVLTEIYKYLFINIYTYIYNIFQNSKNICLMQEKAKVFKLSMLSSNFTVDGCVELSQAFRGGLDKFKTIN